MDKAIAAREILLLGALKEVRETALAAGIAIVPLKGAAFLEIGLYQVGERGMTDVDVLVRPKDLPAFEKILISLGFSPMPNSADAWLRPSPGNTPPAIIDLHTGLRHVKNTDDLFRNLEPGPEGPVLNLAELFLHTAVHPLLHHGELAPRSLEDCALLARKAVETRGPAFWPSAARKAALYNLRPALWPVIKRLREKGALPAAAAENFVPRGIEIIKAAFFEKAARKHSSLLEYFLPVLQRPALLLTYAAPPPRFMLRRYGSASASAYLLRPLRLVLSVLRGR